MYESHGFQVAVEALEFEKSGESVKDCKGVVAAQKAKREPEPVTALSVTHASIFVFVFKEN